MRFGSAKSLDNLCMLVRTGAWQLRNGLDLNWTEGNNWVADVELPAGAVYEYKYVLLDAHSGHALSWQRGNNSVLALRAGEDRVEVRAPAGGHRRIDQHLGFQGSRV